MQRSQTHAHPAYRADIDGLRAVAVLLVVFDHLHTRVHGGYIGVDVFFVISGYLISGTMMREMDAGSFSLAGFYERRVRRIFPALLIMLLGTSALVFHFFVPSEIENYAWSLLSALFSVSNIFFNHQAGYFDAPSSLKPLLHTWSLAVEEQFYFVFPLFLTLIRRWFPHRVKEAVWSAAIISFAMACYWVRKDASAAFFLAPFRFWELLIGTVLSQRYIAFRMGGLQRAAAGFMGLFLIFVPAILYTAQTPFPGLTALPPCIGAALLIAVGEDRTSVVGRILAFRPIAFVGLISYSLYLWHWPILVFQKTGYLLLDSPPDSKQVKVGVFLASLCVAALSWRFVELPFRQGRLRPQRSNLYLVTGTAFLVLFTIAIIMLRSGGFRSRFPEEALRVDAYTGYVPRTEFRQGKCFLESDNTFSDFDKAVCLAPDRAGANIRPTYLLLGDSHAAQLYPGLIRAFPEINFSQATAASCRPFVSLVNDRGTCGDLMRYVFGDVLRRSRPDAVLLGGHWTESEVAELGETVRWLQDHGQRLVLFGPTMEFREPLPRLLAMSLRDRNMNVVEQHRDASAQKLDTQMATLASNTWHVQYISAFQDICATQVEMVARAQKETRSQCPLYAAPGVPLLFDTDHLTPQGSLLYANAIRERKQLP